MNGAKDNLLEDMQDTLLLTKLPQINNVEEDAGLVVSEAESRYYLQVWNRTGVRHELATVLSLDVFRPKTRKRKAVK